MRTWGLETVAALLLRSFAVHQHWIPESSLVQARAVFEGVDLLGVFICVVIVGSLLGITRRMLLAGITRIWLPLLSASVAATVTGTLAGIVAGGSAREILLRTLIPAMAGGLTAGALPLAVAYAGASRSSSGAELALMLPAVVLANMVGVLVAGMMRGRSDRKRPQQVSLVEPAPTLAPEALRAGGYSVSTTLGAIALLAGIYLCGTGAHRLLGYPASLVILVTTAGLRLLCPLPLWLTDATAAVYRGFIRAFTYPLLVAVGLLLMPWQSLMDGLKLSHLAALACAITTLAFVGGWAARWVGLPSADSALISITRVAMGGSGDVAILNAAQRLDLMPFAQIATRIGGAVTLALTLLVLSARS